MKIALILEAINRWTGPVDAARSSLNKLTQSVRQAGERLMYMRDLTIDAGHHFRKMVGEEGLARANRSMQYFRNQLSGVTGAFTLMKYASGAAAIGLGEEFVRGVFAAGGAAEQMRVSLTRLEGSAAKARQAMSWMQSFAMGPGAQMSMDDVMRSYQMAKNFGMDPQGGSLAAFADLAATERRSLQTVLFAVKDAMEGTSTRPLANLGIKMKQGRKPGEANSYLYPDLAGKWVTEHSAKTPEATLQTLIRIINSKYSGMAAQQAQTVPGGIAQLKKLLYLFEMKVADSGVMDWALKRLNQFFAFIHKAMADGSFDRWAKKVANGIMMIGDKLFSFINSKEKIEAIGKDIAEFVKALGMVLGIIKLVSDLGGGGLGGLVNIWVIGKIIGITNALMGLSTVLAGVAITVLSLDIAVAPLALIIGGVILVVGLLAAAAYWVWANWGHVGKSLKKLWDDMPHWAKIAVGLVLLAFDPLLGLPMLIMAEWDKLPAYFKGLMKKIPGEIAGIHFGTVNDTKVPATSNKWHWPSFRFGTVNDTKVPAGHGGTAPASQHHIVITFGRNGQPDKIQHDGDSTLTVRRGITGVFN